MDSVAVYSATQRFVVGSLQVPIPISPTEGAQNVPLEVILKWHSVPGADYYDVAVRDVVGGFNHSFETTTDTVHGPPPLLAGKDYIWQVRSRHDWPSATSDFSSALAFTTESTVYVEEEDQAVPDQFILSQNFPNPFNPTTTISYGIPERTHVRLEVIDLLGRKVQTLVDSEQDPGRKSVRFSASSLPSGLYFYRLQSGAQTIIRKMLVAK